MTNFRRLYLYFASALSLLLFLSGGISLAGLWFSGTGSEPPSDQLARALAYFLIGLFSLVGHWSVLQNRIARHPEEAAAPERAVFLYSLLLVILFTLVLNVLALLDHFLLSMLGAPAELAIFGNGQTLTEWLATILLCSLVAAVFLRVLQQDGTRAAPNAAWQRVTQGYRYAWLLFNLSMLLIGLQQTVQFVLQISLVSGAAERAALGNGLALILVAAPLWLIFERSIQKSSAAPEPEVGEVRLTFNAGIYLILTTGLLFTLGAVVSNSLHLVLNRTTSDWLAQTTLPLSLALPLTAVWLSYQRKLKQELGSPLLDPDRAYIQRALRYSLVWLGLATGFIGLQFLVTNLINLAVQGALFGPDAWSDLATVQIARAIPAFLIGFPVWLTAWPKVSRQARLDYEIGETSHQTRPRQLYLSGVVLLGLAGFILSAGWLIYQIARSILDGLFPGGLLNGLPPAAALLLWTLLLVYHLRLQESDQRQTLRHRNRLYALYPVLVLVPETSSSLDVSPDDFGAVVANALEREMPGLPIAVHVYTHGAPDETLSAAKAVILPAQLLANPPESIQLWLQSFPGARLVIPESFRDWYWLGTHRSRAHLARLAAHQVRLLAEKAGRQRV